MTNITRQNAFIARHNRYILNDANDTRRNLMSAISGIGCFVGIVYAAKKLPEPVITAGAIIGEAIIVGLLIGKIVMELLSTGRNESANETTPFGNPTFTYEGSDIQRAVLRAAYDTMPTVAEIA